MKFTKEEFSEELKTRLTDGGKKPMSQSKRTFNASVERIYKRLEKREDESDLDEAVSEYLPDFEEVEGNMRKDFSEFTKKWEKDHPEKEEHPDKKEKPDKKDDEKGDNKLDILLQKIEELEKRQKEKETEEKISGKRKSLKEALKKEGVEDKDWIENYIKKIHITEDTNVEEEKKDALSLFNKAQSHIYTQTSPFKTGGGNGGEFDLDDLRKKKKDK